MKFTLLISCALFLSCTDAETETGAELCAELGGQCVLGSVQCAERGDADCNPDINPGGAFCCLSCGDSGPEATDAGLVCH